MKKVIGILGIFTLLSLLFTACDKKDAIIVADEKIEIEFFNTKKEVQGVMDTLISKFEKENPHITVKHTMIVHAYQVLLSRMASNDIPDIFVQWPNTTWRNQVKQGYILDLTGEVAIANIQEKVLEKYKIDGKDYSAPITYNTIGVFYNKRIYNELGLSVPKTFGELLNNCEVIRAAGLVPFTYMGKESTTLYQQWYILLPSMNDYDGFLEDALRGDLSKRASDLRTIATKFLQLTSYAQADMMSINSDQAISDFANEKAAMMVMGSWKIGPIKDAGANFDFEMFTMPGDIENETMVTAFPGDFALCIASTSKYPEEAKKFIEFLTKAENAQIYADSDGNISCINDVISHSPQLTRQIEAIQAGNYRLNPDANWSALISEKSGVALQELVINQDIEQFVNTLITIYQEGVQE